MKLIDGLYDEVILIETQAQWDDFDALISMMCGAEKTAAYLSSGAYGQVYEDAVHNNTVIKVGNALYNSGYLAFLKLARRHQDNPFFPKIHHVSLVKTEDDCFKRFVVRMERLKNGYITVGNTKWYDITSYVADVIESPTSINKCPVKKEPPKELFEAANTLRRIHAAGKGNFDWDLHDGNMMLRPNGQLVITDPLA